MIGLSSQFSSASKRLMLVMLVLMLGACSTQMPQPNQGDLAIAPQPAVVKPQPIASDTLFQLLAAEMAGQRQHYKLALDIYLEQAAKTQQPQIAERATRIAQFLGSPTHILLGLSIWLKLEPNNVDALQLQAATLMELGRYQEAITSIEQIQTVSGISQYEFLASAATGAPQGIQQGLNQQLQQIRQQQPQNASLWLATGIMQQHLGNYTVALSDVEKAIRLAPKLQLANMQKARVLLLQDKPKEALAWLNKLHKKNPEHKGIAVLRARVLLDLNHANKALIAFQEVQQSFPDDAAILLSLALLYDDLGYKDEAENSFHQLLDLGQYDNEAHFYLGRLGEERGDNVEALEHYTQVGLSREFLPAQVRTATLLAEDALAVMQDYMAQQRRLYPKYKIELLRIETEILSDKGQTQEAIRLLDAALLSTPNHAGLLYSRAMLAERIGNLALLEQDLRQVLKLQPNNAEALNALGYTLVDQTDRWNEALPLIQRAYELAPNNPAIIDSLGWAYFRMGDMQRAKPLLEEAFQLVNDHEIAAHYGELLWIMGEKQQAMQVWKKGNENNPNSEIISKTLQRLNVDAEQLHATTP